MKTNRLLAMGLLITTLFAGLVLAQDREYPYDFKATKLMDGKTLLEWKVEGPGQYEGVRKGNFYNLYCSTNATLTEQDKIVVAYYKPYTSTRHMHIFGNIKETLISTEKTFYYFLETVKTNDALMTIYDDSRATGVHAGNGNLIVTEDTEGFASGKSRRVVYNEKFLGYNLVLLPFGVWVSMDISQFAPGTKKDTFITFFIRPNNLNTISILSNTGSKVFFDKEGANELPLRGFLKGPLNLGKWTKLAVNITNITSNGASDLEKMIQMMIRLPAGATNFDFNVDRIEAFKGKGTAALTIITPVAPVANKAVMREDTIEAFDKVINYGYAWSSGTPGEFMAYPINPTSKYSLPEKFSYDGNGAVIFAWNMLYYGGVGFFGSGTDVSMYDRFKIRVRGVMKDPTLWGVSDELFQAQPDQYEFFVDRNNCKALFPAVNFRAENQVPLNVYNTGDWEEITIDKSILAPNGWLYWLAISPQAGTGALALDAFAGVIDNVFAPAKEPLEYSVTELKLLSVSPADDNGDTPRMSKLDAQEDSYVKLLFNKPFGGDPTLDGRTDRKKNTAILDLKISDSQGNNYITTNNYFDWIAKTPVNPGYDPNIIDSHPGSIYVTNKIKFVTGVTYTFTLGTNTCDRWGNNLKTPLTWTYTPQGDVIQYPKLAHRFITPEINEYATLTFNTSDPANEMRCLLLNSKGVPVAEYPISVDASATASPNQMIVRITGKDSTDTELPPGLYVVYLKATDGTLKKDFKKTLIIR